MNGYFSTFFTTYNCLTSFDKLGVRHIIRYSMFSFLIRVLRFAIHLSWMRCDRLRRKLF